MRPTTEQTKPKNDPWNDTDHALKLQSMTLHNFKGATDYILAPNGGDISIYGDNATGKTTLADAFYWCLFGKDSHSSSDFDLKTIDKETGKTIPKLQHSVALELSLGGKRFKFSRCYAEDYRTSRGKLDKEFAGHTTKYHLNDVPVKKKEYDLAVGDLCDASQFRLLTDPTFANETMHWQDFRSLLLEVCGDVSDADVIASDSSLKDLTPIIAERTLDEHRKIVIERRKLIKDEREGIPLRIDEVNRGAPPAQDVPGTPTYNLASLREELSERTKESATIAAGGGVAEKTVELREAEGRAQELLNAAVTKQAEEIAAANQSRYAAVNLYNESEIELNKFSKQQDDAIEELARLDKWLDNKIEEYNVENTKEFTYTGALECPACERALDADLIAEAREKAEGEFNLAKAKKLSDLLDEGKRGREKHTKLESEGEDLTKSIEAQQERCDGQKEAIPAKIENAKGMPKPEDDQAYTFAKAKVQLIKDEIETLTLGNEGALADLQTTMTTLQTQITLGEHEASSVLQRKRADERIVELSDSEKKLSAEYETLDRQRFLIEEFTRTKVSMLTGRINERFKWARFKLFKELIGGGIEECCLTTHKGVPYGSLNHGAKLNVGLDIINTLTEHFGFAPPVFIDNAESVTTIIPTAGQAIRLIVSASDKVLRTHQDVQL